MKKIRLLLLTIIMSGVYPLAVTAGSASVSCVGGGTVTNGNTFTITFSGNADTSAVFAGRVEYNSSVISSQSGTDFWQEGKSVSQRYTFKAIAPGTANVRIVNLDISTDLGDNLDHLPYSSTCSITVVNPTASNNSASTPNTSSSNVNSNNANLSSNNNLSSLSIEGVNITPEFDRGELEYSAEVANNVEKIIIHAEAADSNATVSGYGEKELVEGVNEFNIIVTAENGSTKTYTILVTRQEKDPIKVNINGEEFTVLRKAPEKIEVPAGFTETTIKINGEDVVAYKDAKKKVTLILLADKKGKASFYMYNEKDKTYSKFIETSSSLNLALLDIIDEISGFRKEVMTINGNKVSVLVSNKNKNFILVRAINLDNMEEGLYIYDKDNKSFIKYDGDIYSPSLNAKGFKGIMTSIKDSGYGIFIALGIVVVLLLLILALALGVKNKKLNKLLNKITSPKEEPKKEEVKEEKKEEEIEEPVIEETRTIATEEALSEETIEAKEEEEFEPLDDDIKQKPKKKKTSNKKKKK